MCLKIRGIAVLEAAPSVFRYPGSACGLISYSPCNAEESLRGVYYVIPTTTSDNIDNVNRHILITMYLHALCDYLARMRELLSHLGTLLSDILCHS